MTNGLMFVCGAGGSIFVGVLTLYYELQENSYILPQRYKRPWYYVMRLFMAGLSGGLAMAFQATTPLGAVHIGIAAPLIVETLQRTIPHIPRM